MGNEGVLGSGAELDQAARVFSEWRGRKRKGERIPAELWEMGVDLCSRYPMGKVREKLGLDWNDLKKRIGKGRQGKRGRRKKTATAFVEVDTSGMGVLAGDRSSRGYTLEISRCDGSSLKLVSTEMSCLTALCTIFLRSR